MTAQNIIISLSERTGIDVAKILNPKTDREKAVKNSLICEMAKEGLSIEQIRDSLGVSIDHIVSLTRIRNDATEHRTTVWEQRQ